MNRPLFFYLAGIACFTCILFRLSHIPGQPSRNLKCTSADFQRDTSQTTFWRLHSKLDEFRRYIPGKSFSKKIVFLVDMGIPSGKNRFFVFDIAGDSVITQGLVAHGSGDRGFCAEPVFSNGIESGCSSLGKYRVGKKYPGRFGMAYQLFGLEPTNSHAFERHIVLHAYECVPPQEIYPAPICNSRGCPMVAPAFLKKLQVILDKSNDPVVLWIFH
jgi:hypothetical protein